MIKSVGIDLAGAGEHKVRCLDEEGQLCDGFGFESTPEGLAKLDGKFGFLWRTVDNVTHQWLFTTFSLCSTYVQPQ